MDSEMTVLVSLIPREGGGTPATEGAEPGHRRRWQLAIPQVHTPHSLYGDINYTPEVCQAVVDAFHSDGKPWTFMAPDGSRRGHCCEEHDSTIDTGWYYDLRYRPEPVMLDCGIELVPGVDALVEWNERGERNIEDDLKPYGSPQLLRNYIDDQGVVWPWVLEHFTQTAEPGFDWAMVPMRLQYSKRGGVFLVATNGGEHAAEEIAMSKDAAGAPPAADTPPVVAPPEEGAPERLGAPKLTLVQRDETQVLAYAKRAVELGHEDQLEAEPLYEQAIATACRERGVLLNGATRIAMSKHLAAVATLESRVLERCPELYRHRGVLREVGEELAAEGLAYSKAIALAPLGSVGDGRLLPVPPAGDAVEDDLGEPSALELSYSKATGRPVKEIQRIARGLSLPVMPAKNEEETNGG
jgi:hypothetical protein